jgi:hypothetical protein
MLCLEIKREVSNNEFIIISSIISTSITKAITTNNTKT